MTTTDTPTRNEAIFAGGCFWQTEADFRKLPGVTATEVGYTGGSKEKPTYHEVCSDTTGHAEAVRVEFDPQQISYEELVDVFFKVHDPTQLNRQGPDVGRQYRSAIFVHDETQRKVAEAVLDRVQQASPKPVVTEVNEAVVFWGAEDYHQRYLEKRGLATCHVNLRS